MGIPRTPLLRFGEFASRHGDDVLSYLRANADGMSLGFYNSGRTALYFGLITHFGAEPSGTVLLPSYICSAAMPPFHELGLDVEFYDVERGSEPDVADLASKVTDDTVAILTVNYFGFPTKRFEAVSRLCDEHDLVHVEDNAHSVLSRSGSRLLGTRADWGMASTHKLLAVPDGGVLFTPEPGPAGSVRGSDVSEVDFLVRNVVKRVDSRLFDGGVVQRINRRAGNEDSTGEYELEVGGMSPLTERLLGTVDPEPIIERRRRNYRTVADLIADEGGVEALFSDLPEGVCPLLFPIVATDPATVKRRFRSANVPVRPWPYLPREVRGNDEFSTANYLSNHVLTLPIHHDLNRSELVEKVETTGNA